MFVAIIRTGKNFQTNPTDMIIALYAVNVVAPIRLFDSWSAVRTFLYSQFMKLLASNIVLILPFRAGVAFMRFPTFFTPRPITHFTTWKWTVFQLLRVKDVFTKLANYVVSVLDLDILPYFSITDLFEFSFRKQSLKVKNIDENFFVKAFLSRTVQHFFTWFYKIIETAPAKDAFAVDELVWTSHYVRTYGTFPFVWVWKFQQFIFNFFETWQTCRNFNFSLVEQNVVIESLFLSSLHLFVKNIRDRFEILASIWDGVSKNFKLLNSFSNFSLNLFELILLAIYFQGFVVSVHSKVNLVVVLIFQIIKN